MPTVRPALVAIAACVLVSMLASSACGTRADPNFCCSTAASCAASGTDVAPTRCDDVARPLCDDDGVYGPPRTCVADQISNPCDAPGDCTNPERPFCIDSVCVQCEDGSTCDNPTPACAADTHQCVPCAAPAECAGDPGGAVCLDGACVECAVAADCTTAAAPFCEPTTHTCRGCRADGECGADGVCDRVTGTCTPPGELLYARPGGALTGPCNTPATACTIAVAVSTAGAMRRTIKLSAGMFLESVVIANQNLVLHGAGNAGGGSVIDPPDNMDGVAIAAGAAVTVEDLKITGAGGLDPPNAIQCTGSTSRLTLRRTVIDLNPGGGVDVNGCSFSMVNNIISRNGGGNSVFGGVFLSSIGAGRTVKFEFNTVANNLAPGNIAGIQCAAIGIPIPLESSIVFGNGAGVESEIGSHANCVATDSVVGDVAPGPSNQNTDPLFRSSSDFHLMLTSPVESDAAPGATLDHDVDGDLRPLGTGREPGADEIVP